MRLVDADAVKEALRNRISENIDECINNVPTVCDIEQIRDEIEQMIAESERAIRPFDGMETVIYTKGFKDGIGSAIDVIDKYK